MWGQTLIQASKQYRHKWTKHWPNAPCFEYINIVLTHLKHFTITSTACRFPRHLFSLHLDPKSCLQGLTATLISPVSVLSWIQTKIHGRRNSSNPSATIGNTVLHSQYPHPPHKSANHYIQTIHCLLVQALLQPFSHV